MFLSFKKNSQPKGYPTFDQMCAYFYVVARTERVITMNVLNYEHELNDLYYNCAIFKETKNPLKKVAYRVLKASDFYERNYFDSDIFMGVDYGKAAEEVVSQVDGLHVIKRIFEHAASSEYNRGNTASLAAAIVEELGGTSHLQNSADGSYVSGVVVDDIDTSKVREPKFHLVSRSDYTPQEISQLLQCYYTGIAELTREKLETVDAVRHARSQASTIASAVGGGIEQIKYPELDAGNGDNALTSGKKSKPLLQIGKW